MFGLGQGRGHGQGRGGSRQGLGPVSLCICPKCGATLPHIRGKPCTSMKCPKCGTPMVGKG